MLEAVVRDTAADPVKAVAAVDELGGLGVSAIVGEYHSVVARAVAARAEELRMPFLCSSAVLDTLTDGPSEVVARIAPAQSHGWRIYADFLVDTGHRRVAVAAQASVYWASGIAILRERLGVRGGELVELEADVETLRDALVRDGATALLLLTGIPEPAVSIVRAVREDARLAGVLIGAPAGQPEFPAWAAELGDAGNGVPFLRYLPERFGEPGKRATFEPLAERVASELRDVFGEQPSFVAFEGYDSVLAVADLLRTKGSWADVDVVGTRGRIRFERVPGIDVWQWVWPPVQVADRDPAGEFRVLRA